MATDDRCYACCQENCGYSRCFCSCHGRPSPRETDCPRGVHEPELYRCVIGVPSSAEYWCKWCGVKTDSEGKKLMPGMCGHWHGTCDCDEPGPMEIANERAGQLVKTALEAVEDRKAFEQLDAKCPCKKHRTYKAIRKPTSGCEECWRFYVRMHP